VTTIVAAVADGDVHLLSNGHHGGHVLAREDGALMAVFLEDAALAAPEGGLAQAALLGVQEAVADGDADVAGLHGGVPGLERGVESPDFLEGDLGCSQEGQLLGLLVPERLREGAPSSKRMFACSKVLAGEVAQDHEAAQVELGLGLVDEGLVGDEPVDEGEQVADAHGFLQGLGAGDLPDQGGLRGRIADVSRVTLSG